MSGAEKGPGGGDGAEDLVLGHSESELVELGNYLGRGAGGGVGDEAAGEAEVLNVDQSLASAGDDLVADVEHAIQVDEETAKTIGIHR